MRYVAAVLALTICANALAQEAESPTSGAKTVEHQIDSAAHPVLSTDASWVPILMMLVGGMFIAAAAIGPIVRVNTPEEIPPAHAHDEPPGTSHHHGVSGTINPEPEHQAPHGH